MSISFWPAVQQLAGGTSGAHATIARDSQWTIVAIDTSAASSHVYVDLPTGAEVGDVVEVHDLPGGSAAQITPPPGETLAQGTPNGLRLFRKIDASLWSTIG